MIEQFLFYQFSLLMARSVALNFELDLTQNDLNSETLVGYHVLGQFFGLLQRRRIRGK